MARQGITVYLPPELEKHVLNVAETRNLSASGVIANAVKAQFATNPTGVPQGITRQLARIEAHVARADLRATKAQRDCAVQLEALLLFVWAFLKYNPPLDPDEEGTAEDPANARLGRFLDLVRGCLEPNRSLAKFDRAPVDASEEADDGEYEESYT